MNVTLHGKWDFADGTKIKDLAMERIYWMIHVGPKCNLKCSYKRKADGHLIIERCDDESKRLE